METLYTDEVKRFIWSRPWPKLLVMDVIEYDTYLAFRLYRDNFILFDGERQREIASIIKEVMETLRGMGIPCYLEKEERVPQL